MSDLINCSPNLNARTPGQLLSLTSHLSFGSEKKLEIAISSFPTGLQAFSKLGNLFFEYEIITITSIYI